MVKVSPSSPSWSSIEIFSWSTPLGMFSSSKTTLWGPPLLFVHFTESPLQMEIFAGTKTSCPESLPIFTSLDSAAYAGAATVVAATPAAKPAARAMAARREQKSFEATTVFKLVLRSFQSKVAASEVLRLFFKEFTIGDMLGLVLRTRQWCPVGHLVPGRRGKSSRSPLISNSRSRCISASSNVAFCSPSLAEALPTSPASTRVLKIMVRLAQSFLEY
mmetsp:Transcript_11264/g.27051  ORF Transcript_11264/g.27051 Transcript_11264/m.27051 type:complete len:218 (+) Transcript_11264:264-917(+)